jgi:hypothetical protein
VSSAVLLPTTHYAEILLEDWKKNFSQEHYEKNLAQGTVHINQEHKEPKKSYIGVLKIPLQFLCITLKSESGVQYGCIKYHHLFFF